MQRARADGALTIALTNDPASELGQAAELVLPLAAGPEHAVAATKTYMNELAALAAAGGRRGRPRAGDGRGTPPRRRHSWTSACPSLEPAAAQVAAAFAFVGRMFVIGRGVEFATAREIALKLTETCRVAAEPLTATDLVHGPVAALDPFFPVWAIASPDESLRAVVEAAARAREAGAAVVASGSAAHEIAGAAYSLPVPRRGQPPLRAAALGRPGPALRGRTGAGEGPRRRPAGRLTKVTLAR